MKFDWKKIAVALPLILELLAALEAIFDPPKTPKPSRKLIPPKPKDNDGQDPK